MKFIPRGLSRFMSGCSRRAVINCFLVLVAVLAIAQVLHELQRDDSFVREDSGEPMVSKQVEDLRLSQLSLRPLSDYEEKLRDRNIFSLVEDVAAKLHPLKVATPAPVTVPALYKNLRLRGIILADDPLAILQDPQSRESFFVREQQGIKEAVVKEIREDQVVLEYRGQILKIIR